MGIIDESMVVVQPVKQVGAAMHLAKFDMLRLDLLHPVISGNKWYKLRLNIQHAQDAGYKTIITPGGGYSNHLAATAYAAKAFGLKAIGVVRGRYDVLTPTLQQCVADGMELIFVTQEDYAGRHQPDWAQKLVSDFDNILMIPEGGANEWGRSGAALIGRFIDSGYTHIAVSVGTGTTLIGLRNKLDARQRVLGFAPMKQGAYLEKYINDHVKPEHNSNWQLSDEWHFGGFGKWNDELLAFMNRFYTENKIPLDIVYTSKMMYGVMQLIQRGQFAADDRLLCIHTGGLQGNSSVEKHLIY
jgi:1-aminocyclopropane-1-carboxylate deaminase